MASSSPAETLIRLKAARIGMALRHPFLATSTMRLPFKEVLDRDWCSTAATDGYHIFVNPHWIATLSEEELHGLIAHEVMHVILGHSDRRDGRDQTIWNCAADLAINILLVDQGMTLPADALVSTSFRGIPAEEIYERLRRGADPSLKRLKAKGFGFDQLLDPDDPRLTGLRDLDMPDAEERRMLRRDLVGSVRNQQHGLEAGFWEGELRSASEVCIDWQALLRRWLTERVRSDWRTYPFSKRHVYRGIYLPSVGLDAPGHVIAAIDTSGSMEDETLARIFREIRALRETFPSRLTVIQCDTKIHRVDDYQAEDGTELPEVVRVFGRGGTDFRPLFDWIERHREADNALLLYCTDGYGTFPKLQSPPPTLWIVTERGADRRVFPFGEVVYLRSK